MEVLNLLGFFSWGGKGSPLPDGLVYEGVRSEPMKLNDYRASQVSTISTFDAFLGITHEEDKQEYLDAMLQYMPALHRQFIHDIRKGPSLREFVRQHGLQHQALNAAYNECIKSLSHFRTQHIRIVTRFIIIPSQDFQSQANICEDVSKKGIGGAPLIPFLQSIRQSTEKVSIATSDA